MLGVGIDGPRSSTSWPWVGPTRGDRGAPGRPQPRRVGALLRHIAKLEPDAAAVRVVIEARHGLLVEALVDAGFTVVPVNPELVARRRGPAGKKDDAADARIACLLAWIATPRSSR